MCRIARGKPAAFRIELNLLLRNFWRSRAVRVPGQEVEDNFIVGRNLRDEAANRDCTASGELLVVGRGWQKHGRACRPPRIAPTRSSTRLTERVRKSVSVARAVVARDHHLQHQLLQARVAEAKRLDKRAGQRLRALDQRAHPLVAVGGVGIGGEIIQVALPRPRKSACGPARTAADRSSDSATRGPGR